MLSRVAVACALFCIASTARADFSDADYAKHIEALRKNLPSQDFVVLIEKPFVVIGDEDARTVKARAESTVRWAVKHLKAQYFKKDPSDILNIWLFKDRTSYEKHVKQLFGSEPHTPFGYYSAADKALVMNIATGGGTLVHEIVHPYMAANFPACPPWFNEGLGSLYEQSSERGGKIVGLTNWRLDGLQKAIKDGKVGSFKTLTSANPFLFYQRDKGTNYSQARYLLYYLQEQGLLQKYYDQFTANAKDDPHGFDTLKKVLGEDDLDKWQKKWEAWVMTLKFR